MRKLYNQVLMFLIAGAIAFQHRALFVWLVRRLQAQTCHYYAIWDDFQNYLELFLKDNAGWVKAGRWLGHQFQASFYIIPLKERIWILRSRTKERHDDILAEMNGGFYGGL